MDGLRDALIAEYKDQEIAGLKDGPERLAIINEVIDGAIVIVEVKHLFLKPGLRPGQKPGESLVDASGSVTVNQGNFERWKKLVRGEMAHFSVKKINGEIVIAYSASEISTLAPQIVKRQMGLDKGEKIPADLLSALPENLKQGIEREFTARENLKKETFLRDYLAFNRDYMAFTMVQPKDKHTMEECVAILGRVNDNLKPRLAELKAAKLFAPDSIAEKEKELAEKAEFIKTVIRLVIAKQRQK